LTRHDQSLNHLRSLIAVALVALTSASAHAADEAPRPVSVRIRGRFGHATAVLLEEGATQVRFDGKDPPYPRGTRALLIDIKPQRGSCGILRGPLYCMVAHVAPETKGARGVTSISALEGEPELFELIAAVRRAIGPGLAVHALFERRAAEAALHPGDDHPIAVRFAVGDLEPAMRAAVANRVVPCVEKLAAEGTRVMGRVVDDDATSLTLTVTVRLAESRGSEERWAALFAEKLEKRLEGACALSKTPLRRRIVEVRRLANRISVDFARP
jgi:hypothetical protein